MKQNDMAPRLKFTIGNKFAKIKEKNPIKFF